MSKTTKSLNMQNLDLSFVIPNVILEILANIIDPKEIMELINSQSSPLVMPLSKGIRWHKNHYQLANACD
jgi:hypothetical protein